MLTQFITPEFLAYGLIVGIAAGIVAVGIALWALSTRRYRRGRNSQATTRTLKRNRKDGRGGRPRRGRAHVAAALLLMSTAAAIGMPAAHAQAVEVNATERFPPIPDLPFPDLPDPIETCAHDTSGIVIDSCNLTTDFLGAAMLPWQLMFGGWFVSIFWGLIVLTTYLVSRNALMTAAFGFVLLGTGIVVFPAAATQTIVVLIGFTFGTGLYYLYRRMAGERSA